MAWQATWTDTPGPSAKDEPEEWKAFFSHFYGREMPLNAAYQAEQHRIDAAGPPDVGGLRAAYDEENYPRGYDWDELAAELEGVTLEQYRDRLDAEEEELAAELAKLDGEDSQDQVVAGELPALGQDLGGRVARIGDVLS